MKKMAIVLFLVIFMLTPSVTMAKGAQIVSFDDPVLEAALRKEVGIPSGDVTTKDLAKVTQLSIDRDYEQTPDPTTQVHSLAVLTHCTKLDTLHLNFQNISDMKPLQNLKKLKVLELGGNPITDLSPLLKLTALETLTLYNCQAQDYSPLSKLKKLTMLLLDFSTISDLTPLAKLNKLKVLSLTGTSVTDVTPLSTLASLRTLYLSGCSITDYTPLTKIYDKLEEADFDLASATAMPKETVDFDDPVLEYALRKALLKPEGDVYTTELASLTDFGTWFDYEQDPPEGSRVRSIHALRHCVNLESLDLNFNQIVDITPLAGLTKLTMLGIGGNMITDITPLAALTNLEILRLFDCQASDYSTLAQLRNLKHLALENATITDLTPLASLTSLELLSLNGTAITDVSPLGGLPALRVLYLANCSIDDYSPLSMILPQLEEIDFDPQNPIHVIHFSDLMLEGLIRQATQMPTGDVNNHQTAQITELSFERFSDRPANEDVFDLSVLSDCTQLKQLTLNNIAATDYSPLAALTQLEGLTLRNCKATDYSFLSKMENLRWLDLTGATIADITPLSNCPSLEALTLCFTDVSDLTPLENLTNLFGLKLEGSPITDYSPLAALYPSLSKRDFILPQPGVVRFTDDLLEQTVRAAMNKPKGDITPEEAMAVTSLDLSQGENSETSISILQGLEAFTGLVELNLSGNRQVADLWPISGLTKLEKLNCWQCNILSLKPISRLINLREFTIGYHGSISTLDALSALENLEALDAKGVGLTDISGLVGLAKLQYVGLNHNAISDWSPLTTLPSLNSAELTDNANPDYSVLAGIYPQLTYKDFSLDEPAQTENPASGDDLATSWHYDAATKTLTIQSDAAMQSYQPNQDDAETATQTNAPWAMYLAEIEHIVVSNSVTQISDYAFAYASALQRITIGEGVTLMGWRCLYRCGNWMQKHDLEIIINCATMPTLGDDIMGYTWDNPHAYLMVPTEQVDQWRKVAGGYALRIGVQ